VTKNPSSWSSFLSNWGSWQNITRRLDAVSFVCTGKAYGHATVLCLKCESCSRNGTSMATVLARCENHAAGRSTTEGCAHAVMASTDDGSFGKFLPSVPISELAASCLVGHSHDTQKDTGFVAAQDERSRRPCTKCPVVHSRRFAPQLGRDSVALYVNPQGY
jgi:hypothetical protein